MHCLSRHIPLFRFSPTVALPLLVAGLLAAFGLPPQVNAAGPWYVSPSGNNSHDCLSSATTCQTIGGAVAKASNGDAINVAAGVYSETLALAKSLVIVGVGASSTFVDGGGAGTVVGVSTGITVALSALTIRNGSAALGAGISNQGALSLSGVVVHGNTAGTGDGGGIFNALVGVLTLDNSSIAFNTAGFGAGIENAGMATLVNSAVYSNTASDLGGGLFTGIGSTTVFTNVTLSANRATNNGGGIMNEGTMSLAFVTLSGNAAASGGGLDDTFGGDEEVKGSLLANSPFGGNCSVASLTSLGHNLDSANTCGLAATGDLTGTNPFLGSLQGNGGPTPTHALLPGSPALDAAGGDCPPPATDQRGAARSKGPACDIGAYEVQLANRLLLPLIVH